MTVGGGDAVRVMVAGNRVVSCCCCCRMVIEICVDYFDR